MNVNEYIENLAPDKKHAMSELRDLLIKNLPSGFEEVYSNGMISYVVPLSLYPKGYYVQPSTPLPFISIASQKAHIALYHMGLYSKPDLLNWFEQTYKNNQPSKLNMGKSCIRFKKEQDIPWQLLTELCQKITVSEWINIYESHLLK